MDTHPAGQGVPGVALTEARTGPLQEFTENRTARLRFRDWAVAVRARGRRARADAIAEARR